MKTKYQTLTETAKANAERTGTPWGVFRDTSGNLRAERVNPSALYSYTFRTDTANPSKP